MTLMLYAYIAMAILCNASPPAYLYFELQVVPLPSVIQTKKTCEATTYQHAVMAYRAILKPTADVTDWLSTTTLHPAYFPYPLTLILHAVRISHAYSTRVRSSGHSLAPGQHLAGFLVMVRRLSFIYTKYSVSSVSSSLSLGLIRELFANALCKTLISQAWGGALWTNALLCMPPPQLYSTTPWIIYCSTHIVLTTVFSFVPWPTSQVVDSLYPAIDAVCRSGAIIGSLGLVRSHPNPAVANSLLAQVIIGAVSSVGGGAAAGFLGVWDKEWSLKTPTFLKG